MAPAAPRPRTAARARVCSGRTLKERTLMVLTSCDGGSRPLCAPTFAAAVPSAGALTVKSWSRCGGARGRGAKHGGNLALHARHTRGARCARPQPSLAPPRWSRPVSTAPSTAPSSAPASSRATPSRRARPPTCSSRAAARRLDGAGTRLLSAAPCPPTCRPSPPCTAGARAAPCCSATAPAARRRPWTTWCGCCARPLTLVVEGPDGVVALGCAEHPAADDSAARSACSCRTRWQGGGIGSALAPGSARPCARSATAQVTTRSADRPPSRCTG